MKMVLVNPESGTFHDIVELGSEFPVASPLIWVEVDDAIDRTWVVVDGIPIPPPAQTEEEISNSLDDSKINKINELKKSFSDEVASGLESDALGATHRYDGEKHNIDWVLACTLLTLTSDEAPTITCDDLLGNGDSKQQRHHDGSQCSHLLSDCMNVIQNMKDKIFNLELDVDNAADEAAVNLVVWD